MSDNQQTDDQQQEQTQGDDKQAAKSVDDYAELKAAIKAERDAVKRLTKELQEIKSAGKTDADRLKELEQERNDLAAKVRERDARDTVIEAAKKAGAPDPHVVYRMVKSDLDYADDGEVRNLKTLIDDAKATAPQLFKASTGKADGAAGNGSKPKNFDMNAQIRQMAGREA